MKKLGTVLANIIVAFLMNYSAATKTVRPLYIIGHMANNRTTVDSMLQRGANAIEADLSFNSSTGKATRFYHGIPCDCSRNCTEEESPSSLIEYFRNISTTGPQYVSHFTGLFWIDLKLGGVNNLEKAGKSFAELLIGALKGPMTAVSRLKLILGVTHPDHFKFIKGCVEELKRLKQTNILGKIGTCGSETDHISQYTAANKELGLPPMWLDEGGMNCFENFFFHLTEVKKAIKKRDESNDVSKVCKWTIDSMAHMRDTLSVGVDSIITNVPEKVISVLREPDWQGIYRLATSQDDPFMKI